MANSLCFASACSLKPPPRVGVVIGNSVAGKVLSANGGICSSKSARFQSLEVKEKAAGESVNWEQCLKKDKLSVVFLVTAKKSDTSCRACFSGESSWREGDIACMLVGLEMEAADNNQSAKPNSIVCAKCDGNGAVQCSQCKGTGVNSVDHFNGQFKAGGLCWLCRGKRDILCGNCNGAGFVGGFMSTFDD